MIDIKELRRLAQAATPHVGHACKYRDAHWLREGHVDFENADLFIASERPQEDAAFYAAANPTAITELLDRIEAAEKERDSYKIAFSEYSEKTEWVQQGVDDGTVSAKYLGWHRADGMSDLLSTAEKDRDALRAKVSDLTINVEYLGNLKKSYEELIGELQEERDALRAKIEEMERQKPVGQFIRHPSNGLWEQDGYGDNPDARPLYALPGAKGEC